MAKKIAFTLFALFLVLGVSNAQANLLSIYTHGQQITNVGTGSIGTVVNNAPSGFPQFAPDIAVAFDSNRTGTADTDLQYNTGWTGGNIATTYGNNPLGILMILPQNNLWATNPNDAAQGGIIPINFNTNPITSFDFSVVDVEAAEAAGYSVTFYEGASSQTYTFLQLQTRDGSIVWGGDNTANYITPFTAAELGFTSIDKVEFVYGGSGGIALGAPVPVPAAVWLLGTGLLGLVGFRKKLKS